MVPLVACTIAAARCAGAYERARGHRTVWIGFGAGVALAAAASTVALASTLLGSSATAAFYFGALATACLLAGSTSLGLRALSRASFNDMADALIFGTLIAAMSVYFVVAAGHGERRHAAHRHLPGGRGRGAAGRDRRDRRERPPSSG